MLRVIVLCEYTSLNGGERSLLAILDDVRRAEIEPVVICPPTGPLVEQLIAKKIEHIPFSFCDERGTKYPLATLRGRLETVLTRSSPHLLHANSVSTSRLSGPVARTLGLPSIGHLRDMLKLSATAVSDLSQHTRLIAVSKATRQWFVSSGVDQSKLVVTYNGVDIQRFQPRAATGFLRAQLGLPAEAVLIGAVGQIGLRKGWEVLLEAMAQLAARFLSVHLVAIGRRFSQKQESRRYEADLHRLAEHPRLAGRVHFLGYRNDVPELMNELTIVAHAAHQEPLGRILLEAAASGKAIVATDVGGTREIFPPQCNAALIVPPNQPDMLAAAMATLVRDSDTRHALEQAARRRAVNTFDAHDAARRTIALYRDVARSS